MELKMYIDVFQGWTPAYAYANSNPPFDKPENCKRLSFTVDIPDHFIAPDVDWNIQEVATVGEEK